MKSYRNTKTMKFISDKIIFIYLCSVCLLPVFEQVSGHQGFGRVEREANSRLRQAGNRQQSTGEVDDDLRAGSSISSTSSALASASVSSSTVRGGHDNVVHPSRGSAAIEDNPPASGETLIEDLDDKEPLRPAKKIPPTRPDKKHKQKRPVDVLATNRRRAEEVDDDGRYDDRDCEDDDYDHRRDYGNMFNEMASNPMRHFRRMMNNVFDRIPIAPDFGSYNDGGDNDFARSSGSMASAYSSDDGYSQLSSSVTNNGRTRGIISETRNGRTKTRRLGDGYEDED